MSVRVKFDPISRDIELMISDLVAPQTRSKMLADYSREVLDESLAINKAALGHDTPYESFVDNQRNDNLDAVKPDGRIVFEFQLFGQVLDWIGEQLVTASPVLTGAYANAHMLFAENDDVTGMGLSQGGVFTFINTLPYARKIERGLSPQAPEGVYEAVAAVAASRFGNMAKISFTYRAVLGMKVVNQDLAASSGASWWLGHSGNARAASGAVEAQLGAQFGQLAHNRSDVRFPAIVVRF